MWTFRVLCLNLIYHYQINMHGQTSVYNANICTQNTHIHFNTVYYSMFPLLFFFLKSSLAAGPRLWGRGFPPLTVSVLVSFSNVEVLDSVSMSCPLLNNLTSICFITELL